MTVIRAAKYLALVDTGKTVQFVHVGTEGLEKITGTLVEVNHSRVISQIHEITKEEPKTILGPGQTTLEVLTNDEKETYRLNPEHEVQLTGTQTIR